MENPAKSNLTGDSKSQSLQLGIKWLETSTMAHVLTSFDRQKSKGAPSYKRQTSGLFRQAGKGETKTVTGAVGSTTISEDDIRTDRGGLIMVLDGQTHKVPLPILTSPKESRSYSAFITSDGSERSLGERGVLQSHKLVFSLDSNMPASSNKAKRKQREQKNSTSVDVHGFTDPSKVWTGYDVETSSTNISSHKSSRISSSLNLHEVTSSQQDQAYASLLTPRTRYERISNTLDALPPDQSHGVSALVKSENTRQLMQQSYEASLAVKQVGLHEDGKRLSHSMSAPALPGVRGQSRHGKKPVSQFAQIDAVLEDLDKFSWRSRWYNEDASKQIYRGKMNEEKRQQAWLERRAKLSKSHAAAANVERKLKFFRDNEEERRKLIKRVAEKERAKRLRYENTKIMSRNKHNASSSNLLKTQVADFRQSNAERAAAAKRKRAIQERIREAKLENYALQAKGSESLDNLPPKEKAARIRFQTRWLKIIQLMSRMSDMRDNTADIMEERIRESTCDWVTAHVTNNQRLALLQEVTQNRSKALKVIFRHVTPWIKRVRWRLQRKRCMYLWRFLTLAKNIHFMRMCIRKNSYRSKIVRVQQWWKNKVNNMESPALMIEIKWANREGQLIDLYNEERYVQRQTVAAEKKRKRNSVLIKGSSRGSSGMKKKANVALIKHEELKKALDATDHYPWEEARLKEMRSTRDMLGGGGDGNAFVMHKVPAPFRRRYVARYLEEERARDAENVKKWIVETREFLKDNEEKLAEVRLAKKMKLDEDMAADWLEQNQPKAPYRRMFNLPSNEYIDEMIKSAYHEWVLSMANSKIESFSSLKSEYTTGGANEVGDKVEATEQGEALDTVSPMNPAPPSAPQSRHSTLMGGLPTIIQEEEFEEEGP